jgi:hypothetical protein
MSKKTTASEERLAEQFAKAIRRAEKLERTLLKIVGQSETPAPAGEFMRAVQEGLAMLRKESGLLAADPAPKPKKKKKVIDIDHPAEEARVTKASSMPKSPAMKSRNKPKVDAVPASEGA